MLNAVPRHNVNLTTDELRLVIDGARGRLDHPDGCERFEAHARRYFGAAHCSAVQSGRSALFLALWGLDLPNNATVVLPNYCFFSLVKVVEGMGYTPRFAPIDPNTFALDPAQLGHHITDADAVVVIHPFGQLAPMDELLAVCAQHGVPLVEDAAQATGARKGPKKAGAMSDVGVFSLVSGKNLQTFGGGLVVTDREDVHRRIQKRLRNSLPTPDDQVRQLFQAGLQRWFLTTPMGFRFIMHPVTLALQTLAPAKLESMFYEERARFDPKKTIDLLSDAQGALGCLEITELDRRNTLRRSNAMRLLDGLLGVNALQLPQLDDQAENSFNAVAVRTTDAQGLAHRLRRAGFDTRSDYMEWFGDRPDFTEDVIYLPNHPAMSADDVDRLVQAVRAAT